MDVTAKYELIGLMAYPIRHSLSPEMQNKALEKAGLPFTYMAFEVDNDSFPGAIEGLKALKMRGTGVSMPNKQLACEYVDELTPAAKLVGAGNDSNLLIVFYVQIMPDDFVMQLHRF
ncbi:quinate/shikimate dehydrogenase [Escherichia coli]|nr:quinate/shikimate dehydrogenase [Escherichia coli]SQN73371.1 quinate/shikimate dehydrogenase [Escherichia coli]SQQ65531.1 quinate/shikimate dehydrogenase [Escherichia coli]